MSPKYRSIFISDVHFGSVGCQSKPLFSFLEHNTCENLYLLGDIFDLWLISAKKNKWKRSYYKPITFILSRLQKKKIKKLVYIPGNHDEGMRHIVNFSFGHLEIKNNDEYIALSGRKYYLTHGDEIDTIIRMHIGRYISRLGAILYDILIRIDRVLKYLRKKLGMPRWSFSAFVKKSVKKATKFISGFEKTITNKARLGGYQGVICGHIHQPTIKQIDGIDYINCGDWVEHCTAVVETWNGEFKIIQQEC